MSVARAQGSVTLVYLTKPCERALQKCAIFTARVRQSNPGLLKRSCELASSTQGVRLFGIEWPGFFSGGTEE